MGKYSPTEGLIEEAILEATDKYGIDYELLYCIAIKESGLNPNAVGDHGKAKGLFQIHTDKHLIGDWCVFDAECSADFTAKMIKAGKGSLWTTFASCRLELQLSVL